MENHLFNLRFTARSLKKSSKKAEKDEAKDKGKVKQCIEKGDLASARVYAESAIRQKNEVRVVATHSLSQALNYLRMSARVDAVASRVESALRMRMLTHSMAGIVKSMDKVAQSMDLEQLTHTLDEWEKQSETLQVSSDFMETAMQQSTAANTPEQQVDVLLQQVAAEHNLELGVQLSEAGHVGAELAPATAKETELEARLARLKNPA